MKLNFTGKITKFFLENRPLTILVLLGVILAGALSYTMTPKQYNPNISMPVFEVTIDYPGATAEEVENLITRELEEKIADVSGVDKIFSQSMDGGRVITNVLFKVGENFEDSKVKLTNKIQGNIDLRKGTMQNPIIKSISADDVPILTFGFSNPNLPQNEIREQAYTIMNLLKRVPNTANLEIHGGESRALVIELNTGKMQERGIAISDIKNAIQATNFRLKTGTIETPETTIQIETNGLLQNAKTAKKLMIANGIKLEDVATVTDNFRKRTSFVEVFEKNNKSTPTVFLSIAKRKGANTQTVSQNVQQELNKILEQETFANLNVKLYRDEGKVASEAISGLLQSFILSILIVTAVLWIFLGRRSASVVAIAIPLTMACVFIAGLLFEKTINRITLFALILSLGLLVDSATVVVENIFRHFQKLQQDASASCRHNAIITAVNEVGIGLFLSTLTSVIVFLPTAKITGMMGDYMGPLSFFVPAALIFSLFVAYVLTPTLADLFLPKNQKANPPSHGKFFDKVTNIYSKFLEKVLNKKKFRRLFLTGIFGALLLVFTFPVLKIVHFKMLPSANKNQFFIYIDAPEGTNFPQTRKISEFIAQQALQNPNIKSVQSFTGEPSVIDFNGLFKGSQHRISPNLATLRVNLIDKNERSAKSTPILNELRQQITQKISETNFTNPTFAHTITETKFKLLEDPPGPPVRATLVAKIKGPNREILKQIAHDFSQKFANTKQVVDVDTTISHPAQKISLQIDHQKALQTGITTDQVYETLNAMTDEIAISQFHQPNSPEMIDIILKFPTDKTNQITDLNEIFIKNMQGDMIPLSAITKQNQTRTSPILSLDERDETVLVTAELDNRSVVYANIDLIKEALNYELPNGGKVKNWNLFGINYETENKEIYRIEWGGEWQMTLENFRDLGLAMAVAFILIYAVLVAQFSSFKIPLLAMSTVFLGFLGILPGFALLDITFGTFLTATSLIGFIALIGIVVNNAIIYLEYYEHLMAKNTPMKESLFLAGQTRLRPIILTSMTTVLGNLTIVNDPVWSGLAWSIVFGLSISALFTLGVFPALMVEFVKVKK